jgi:hypothetical protein
LTRPWRDLIGGLDALLRGERPHRRLALVAGGALAGWWLYVPAHELLHAAACLLAGGSVSRLEIAPEYGGHLLARIVPFVVAGGQYAGRLAGFDTGGSDWRYLATDFGPFVLTLFPGVWLLRRSARRERPIAWGLALPLALAPLLSLTGDAYEIGSIVVTNLPPWSEDALLRGDDALRVLRAAIGPRSIAGFVLAAVLGAAWSLATYALGSWIAARLGEGA